MNIQSTALYPTPQIQREELGKEFKQAKEEFLQKSEDHFERQDWQEKWGTAARIGLGAGVYAGGIALMMKFAPGVEGYGIAFPPLFAAAVTVWAAGKVSNNVLEKKLAETNFQQSRETLVEKRDQYRSALLQEVDDKDVHSITTARWNELISHEDPKSPLPTLVEMKLLEEVQDIEFLADQRQKSGWMGALARVQDDPKLFGQEVQTVVRHGYV